VSTSDGDVTPAVKREGADAPFNAGFRLSSAGDLSFLEHFADAVSLGRSAREIAQSPVDGYHLFLQMEGVWHLEQGDRSLTIEPGMLLLLDPNQPFRSVKCGRWRHRTICRPSSGPSSACSG
jgi:hypothetical protein